MARMNGFSPSWDCETLARQSSQKQRPTNHRHHLRNKISLENDHLVGMQPDKRNKQIPPFPTRSRPQDEHDRNWSRKSHDPPLFLGREQRRTSAVSDKRGSTSKQALCPCPL